jgi:hypothetical protein
VAGKVQLCVFPQANQISILTDYTLPEILPERKAKGTVSFTVYPLPIT